MLLFHSPSKILFLTCFFAYAASAINYDLRASHFLGMLIVNGQINHQDDVKMYLRQRIEADLYIKEIQELTPPQSAFFIMINIAKDSSYKLLRFLFPQLVQEMLYYRLHQEMGCHCIPLSEYETNPKTFFIQVSQDEFTKRLREKFDKLAVDNMTLEESKKMASAILALIS